MAETVLVEVTDGIAVLTLNQPDRRNAMSEEMGEALAVAAGALAARDDVRVVVLRGAGVSFCAGGDLDLIEAHSRRPAQETRRAMLAYYERYLAVHRLEVPTIAAIHGHAVGGGLALALTCDLRYAAEDARLGVNFARLGLHPGMASTLTLPQAVGAARAFELFYTGRLVTGREAEALGLVNRALPAERLWPAVLEVAGAIAANAPLVVRLLKRAVRQALDGAVRAALEYEAFAQALTYASADLREGLAAFRGRRAPRFTGR